ncbi:MAG: HEPN domain-containing protein [Bifidobacterium sp.]
MKMTIMYQHAETAIKGLRVAYPSIKDPAQRIAFTGMVVVAATTSYEIEIHEALLNFIDSKHNAVLSTFAREQWNQMNGHISYPELTTGYLKYLGNQYCDYFKNLSSSQDKAQTANGHHIINSYAQVIRNRNSFVHGGMEHTSNLTFEEAIKYYKEGKYVIQWFSNTLKHTFAENSEE